MGSTSGISGTGALRIFDEDSSQYVELTVPATVSTGYTLTLPSAVGSNGQVLTTDGSGNLSFADAAGALAVMSSKTLDNPNAYDTSGGDNFGYSVAISGNYSIVGAYLEDDAGGSGSGKAYIFNATTGSLVHTLDNPNAYGTSAGDFFGSSVAISGNFAIVGAYFEDDAGADGGGKAYIFNVADGSLLHTLSDPLDATNDNFGWSVGISGNYAIVGGYRDGVNNSGTAYIFDVATGSLLYTLVNPNDFGTADNDRFGVSVAISGNYAIVGADSEDDTGVFTSGKAYIYDISTFTSFGTISTANYKLSNPNAYDTSAGDQFGYSVAISGNYAIVGAIGEDDAGGTSSGKAYIYDISTFTTSNVSSANYVLDNPNAYNTSQDDSFGWSVGISGNYAIVGASGEDDGGSASGKAYIYDISTFTTSTISSANYVLDNPNAYSTSAIDRFGSSVAISGNYVIVGASLEDDAGGSSSGKAYIFRTNGHPYSYNASEIILFAPSGGISNVVEDTTPQLGGDLQTQGSKIFAGSNDEDLILEGGSNPTTSPFQVGGDVFISGGSAPNSFFGSVGSVNITGRTTVNGSIVLKSIGSSFSSQLQFYEAADNGTSSLILKGPVSLAGDVTLTLPAADGANGQVLTTDGSGNLSFTTISGGIETDRYAYEDTKTFVVTVDTKDSTHPQFNNGSENGYKIDGAFAPFLHMVPGMTYHFDQSDASNSGHPVVFYYDENKTTSYTDGVTNNGTPGIAGAYTQIVVSDTTPSTLYYQCSAHALMGWGANISTHNLTGLDTDDLTEGAGNLYYTTSRFNTDFGNKSTSDLSEGTNLYHTTERARTSINATGDISYNSTTGTISFNNTSGYLTSETYSTASELLTAIKTVDGASSGLEADLLDGQEGSYYLNYSNLSNTPTSILNFGITDGTAGQVLQTDGSGNFSFTTVSGGGGGGVGYAGYEDYFFNVSSQTSSFGTSSGAHDKVQVFVNGAYLDDSDFTFNANTGIVTLTTAAENGDEVSVWGFNSTGLTNHELFTVDGSGNITAPGTIQIGNHRKEGSLTSTISSTSPTDILLYFVVDYVGAKLIITVKDNVTGDTQISEALILTDPDQIAHQITTYGTMYTSTNALATFDAGIYTSYVPLTVTMASSNSSTVKVAYTLIDA